MKHSVTSVALPDLDVGETCSLLKRLGYDGVEWRVRYTPESAAGGAYTFWGRHKSDLDPDNIARRAPELSRICGDHGLEVAAIAANVRATELDVIRKLAEGSALMGKPPIRIGCVRGYDRTVSYNELFQESVEAFGKALEILEPYGIRALVEIHGGTIVMSAALAHRLVSRFPAERIGVIYDVNNMARGGLETPRLGMELLGKYLQHVHIAGSSLHSKGRREDGTLEWEYLGCDLADSVVDTAVIVDDLGAVRYAGFVSIEDFRPIEHERKLGSQIEYLRRLEARRGPTS